MRHFVDLDGNIGGVVASDFPALSTHIACTEKGDSAISFPNDDATVDSSRGVVDCGVDGDVEAGERVAGFAVVVAVQALE